MQQDTVEPVLNGVTAKGPASWEGQEARGTRMKFNRVETSSDEKLKQKPLK